ncbi:MAG: hypothetical protein COB99_08465 [Sulfurimonas sp.]|nr:MAG: hypothetical protein COB99_08465 [Sulfurimonas sp.]
MEIIFTSFEVELNYDYLYIYDGATTTDPSKLVATYTGTGIIPASISSTGASLSLKFTSDGSVIRQGFKATIACLGNPAPLITNLSPLNGSVNNAGTTDLILTFNEVVNPVAGKFIEIRTVGTNALLEQIDVGSTNITGGGTNTITINPSTNLPTGDNYVLINTGAFQDIANADFAGLTNVNDWTFSTRSINFDGFAGTALQLVEPTGQLGAYAEVPNNAVFDLQDEFTIEFNEPSLPFIVKDDNFITIIMPIVA